MDSTWWKSSSSVVVSILTMKMLLERSSPIMRDQVTPTIKTKILNLDKPVIIFSSSLAKEAVCTVKSLISLCMIFIKLYFQWNRWCTSFFLWYFFSRRSVFPISWSFQKHNFLFNQMHLTNPPTWFAFNRWKICVCVSQPRNLNNLSSLCANKSACSRRCRLQNIFYSFMYSDKNQSILDYLWRVKTQICFSFSVIISL